MDNLNFEHRIMEIKEELGNEKNWKISEYFCDENHNPNNNEDRVKIVLLDHDYIKQAASQVLEEFNSTGTSRRNSRRKRLICEKCNKEFLLPVSLKIHKETHDNDDSGFDQEETTDAVFLEESVSDEEFLIDVISSSTNGDYSVFENEMDGSHGTEHESTTSLSFDSEIAVEEPQLSMLLPSKRSGFGTSPICKKQMPRDSLWLHIPIHADEKPFACSVCKRRFSRKDSSIRHLIVHRSDNPKEQFSQCTICKKFYPSLCLNLHIHSHKYIEAESGTSQRLPCEICGMMLSRKANLNNHVRLHLEEKRHECEICDKKYLFKSSVRKHMKFHIGIKDKECNICKKKFVSMSDLTRHQKIHLGMDVTSRKEPRKYPCSICKRLFRFPSTLRDHVLAKHSAVKSHVCPVCSKAFSVERRLVDHMNWHREKPHMCKICGKGFVIENNFKIHLKVHSTEKPFASKLRQSEFATKAKIEISQEKKCRLRKTNEV